MNLNDVKEKTKIAPRISKKDCTFAAINLIKVTG
jgi:hypothetical protein